MKALSNNMKSHNPNPQGELKVKTLVKLLIVISASAITSHAEFPLSKYHEIRDLDAFKAYINGVGIGMAQSNAMSFIKFKVRNYCQPDKLKLGPENYIGIIDEELKANEKTLPSSFPIETLLLMGLVNTFPCNQSDSITKSK